MGKNVKFTRKYNSFSDVISLDINKTGWAFIRDVIQLIISYVYFDINQFTLHRQDYSHRVWLCYTCKTNLLHCTNQSTVIATLQSNIPYHVPPASQSFQSASSSLETQNKTETLDTIQLNTIFVIVFFGYSDKYR